jgi:hypothetical protein
VVIWRNAAGAAGRRRRALNNMGIVFSALGRIRGGPRPLQAGAERVDRSWATAPRWGLEAGQHRAASTSRSASWQGRSQYLKKASAIASSSRTRRPQSDASITLGQVYLKRGDGSRARAAPSSGGWRWRRRRATTTRRSGGRCTWRWRGLQRGDDAAEGWRRWPAAPPTRPAARRSRSARVHGLAVEGQALARPRAPRRGGRPRGRGGAPARRGARQRGRRRDSCTSSPGWPGPPAATGRRPRRCAAPTTR